MEVKTRTGEIYRFRAGAGGGYLLEQLDRFGNSTKITRSGSQINRITSPSGRYVDFIYTGAYPTEVKDFTGRSVRYLNDANGYLTKVTYPDNTTEEYTYNTSGNMLTVKDRRANTMVTNEYDANQRVHQANAGGRRDLSVCLHTRHKRQGDAHRCHTSAQPGAAHRLRCQGLHHAGDSRLWHTTSADVDVHASSRHQLPDVRDRSARPSHRLHL